MELADLGDREIALGGERKEGSPAFNRRLTFLGQR